LYVVDSLAARSKLANMLLLISYRCANMQRLLIALNIEHCLSLIQGEKEELFNIKILNIAVHESNNFYFLLDITSVLTRQYLCKLLIKTNMLI
jgi:hypothetical protein